MGDATGELPTYTMVAVLLTFPAAYLVLLAFRYQVEKVMLQKAPAFVAPPSVTGFSAPIAAFSEPATASARDDRPSAGRVRARLVFALTLASLGAAALSTLLFLGFNPDVNRSALGLVLVTYVYAWPLVMALQLGLDLSVRDGLKLMLSYVVLGLAIALIWSAISKWVFGRDATILENAVNYLRILAANAAPPYLALMLVSARWMRPVSPFLLAALLVFCFGAMASHDLFLTAVSQESLRSVSIRLGETGFLLIIAIPVGYLCWRLQRLAGRHYGRKRFSDTQLSIDAVWLIAAFWLSFDLATTGGYAGLWGLSAFVVYRSVLEFILRIWTHSFAAAPSRLLVLRVFGHRRRSETLFDAVAQRWRIHGNVNMIAGADLAARTVDPGDLLLFISGALRSRFVHSNEIEPQDLDERRDPDGRFRVNDFFCFDDTWQPTLEQLMRRSDLVLMDLRDFASANKGCVHEIRELTRHGRLERTLFVVSEEAGADLLHETIAEAVGEGSSARLLQILSVQGKSEWAFGAILGRLRNMAIGTQSGI